MTMLSIRREVSEFRKRYKWMAAFAIACFLSILGRLVQLQLLEHSRWLGEAQRNITKRITLPATRGVIRDRTGRVIADNRPAYGVYVSPQQLQQGEAEHLATLLQLNADETRAFKKRLAAVPTRRRSRTLRMFEEISRDQYAAVETHKHELPGIYTVVVPVRTYPYGAIGAHAVGFLNEVNADDLRQRKGQDYHAGQRIGRSGLEAAWESYLRGHDGELRTVVDVRGQELSGRRTTTVAERREPVPGRDLRLTLDMELMRTLDRLFADYPSGAAVVVETATGYVRALYSKPAYDLNEMSGRLTQARALALQTNPHRPLIDKTVYESYFPGSTFKPITALAALQLGHVEGDERYRCTGVHALGKRKFRCSHVHGEIDLADALAGSCNVYFYRLGQAVGLDQLADLGRAFGLGQPTGIGINTETDGFIPDRKWYMERNGGRYHSGFTLNAAIGQGNTRVSVLQLAMLYAALADEGTLHVPQLVAQVQDPGGEIISRFPPKVRRRLSMAPEHLALLRRGMVGVVHSTMGTAYDARARPPLKIAGKTGTAQVAQRKDMGEEQEWYFRRSHAWFAGYGPAQAPELAIAVLVEHGGDGGKHAAPIAIGALAAALATPDEPTAARRSIGDVPALSNAVPLRTR